VVVEGGLGRGGKHTEFLSFPPCEMASTIISCLVIVTSMKPYSSSSPFSSGVPSDVIPPPPPEMMIAVLPKLGEG